MVSIESAKLNTGQPVWLCTSSRGKVRRGIVQRANARYVLVSFDGEMKACEPEHLFWVTTESMRRRIAV